VDGEYDVDGFSHGRVVGLAVIEFPAMGRGEKDGNCRKSLRAEYVHPEKRARIFHARQVLQSQIAGSYLEARGRAFSPGFPLRGGAEKRNVRIPRGV
jgi:hypothetical protein